MMSWDEGDQSQAGGQGARSCACDLPPARAGWHGHDTGQGEGRKE